MAAENRKRAARVVDLQENESRDIIEWTPTLIRQAEIDADRGNLRRAADLVEIMLTDDRVAGATEALGSVVSLPLTFDPPDTRAALALTGTRGDWWSMFPEPELKKLIKWGRILGVGFAYVRGWVLSESGRLVADIEVWHARNFRWDRRERKWFVRLDSGTEEPIEPGDGRWIIYSPYGKKRPWADAPWRGMSRWWLIKRYAQHDWAYYSERQGNGTEVVQEKPAGPDSAIVSHPQDVESETARRRELTADLRKLGRNAKIVLPPGFEYRLVESLARTWESFKAQKDAADTALAIACVGQNLSTEIKGGSLAAAEVHSKVEWRIIRDVAESISTMAREQVLRHYCTYNFGSAEIAPWPKFDVSPPEDAKATAETQKLFMEMLGKATDAGFEVENAAEAALKLGLVIKPRAAAPPPPSKTPPSDAESP